MLKLNNTNIGIIIVSIITISSVVLISIFEEKNFNRHTDISSNVKPAEVDFNALISGRSKINDIPKVICEARREYIYSGSGDITLDHYFTAINGFKDIKVVTDNSNSQSLRTYEFVLYPGTTGSFTIMYDATYSLSGYSKGLAAITWPNEFNKENLLKELGIGKVYRILYLHRSYPNSCIDIRAEDITGNTEYLQAYITSLNIIDASHAEATYTFEAKKEGVYLISFASSRFSHYITVGYKAYELILTYLAYLDG